MKGTYKRELEFVALKLGLPLRIISIKAKPARDN